MVSRSSLHHWTRGFTLVELIVVIAIAAILAVIAGPSFQKSISNQKMTTTTRELVSTLSEARADAAFLNRTLDVTFTLTPDANQKISWQTSGGGTGYTTKTYLVPAKIMISSDPTSVSVIHFVPNGTITYGSAVDGSAGIYFIICDNSSSISGEKKQIVYLNGFGAARQQKTLRDGSEGTCS